MSGPISVIILANPVAALLSAAAIRAAAAVYEGYEQAAALQQDHQRDQAARGAAQNAANAQGRHALADASEDAETAFERLVELADGLGIAGQVRATRPARPDATDNHAVAAYIRALQTLALELRSILLTEAARRMQDLPEEAFDIAMPAATSASVPQAVSQRLLGRIAHLERLPEQIESVARELEATLPGERADLLATELRARIQAHLEALQRQQVQEATAGIIKQSLKDLGYQVEEVASTLFVEGGVLHFRRQGWGDYMVRMRIDAKAGAANFNVIRAVAAGANERSVLDHLAEDRWCAEFPALLQALEIRGVRMQVTRRLDAGELPVQLVEASKLPKFADEEQAARATKPLTREIK